MSDNATATPATGEQYVIERGGARAQIGQVAAVLREFSVDGVPYTESWPDSETPPMACGSVLAPWPNRVAGGKWTFAGAPQQLDLTEPARGNAIHGLLRYRPYELARQSADSVTLSAVIYPQAGWPFTLETSVTYALLDVGLQVTHAARNIGSGPAVFGCGAHPYLRIGDVPSEELTVSIRAERQIVTDERMIPTETSTLAGILAGLPTGMRVGDLDLDTGFTGLQLVPGRYDAPGASSPASDAAGNAAGRGEPGRAPARYAHVLTAPDGRTLTLWADAAFAWAQLFTPRNFPAPDGPRQAVAIEPMTCPADALNSGEGLIHLEPGESWQGSWGLTPVA